MAKYALLLNCSTVGNATDNEGAFDSVTWVSPTGNSCPNPNSAALDLDPGDQVAFAVQVKDSSGNQQTTWLDWIAVIVTASTQPGNRSNRNADNNSPFRIGTGNVPNTVLLANDDGAGGTWTFTNYDSNGNVVTTGSFAYQGMAYLTINADIPPGKTAPDRHTSQYEAVVVASLTDSNGKTWQFAFDPEMDVDNGGN
jgi:hypothetical protein